MSDLFTPLRLRSGLVVPNRAWLAPLTNTQSHDDGTLSDVEHRWLLRRARGGWGVISTCAAYISDEGKAWQGQLGVASDAHLPGLTRLATDLRATGARSLVQLHHGGKVASLAPRRLSTADDDGVRGATEDDLRRVIDDFARAAARAAAAGFDGVEVHGANGYLLTQFLAPADNPRQDGWGGDLAGRARLTREVTRAVRAATPAGFTVAVRLSPVDTWAQRGLVLDDAVAVAAWLADDGADVIHLSLRDAAAPPPFEPDAPVVATALRAALPADVALVAAGGVRTAADAARALAAGLDAVVVGRAAIGAPDWPQQVKDPAWAPPQPPHAPDDLRAVDVGEAFITYLSRFPGMVAGGAAPR